MIGGRIQWAATVHALMQSNTVEMILTKKTNHLRLKGHYVNVTMWCICSILRFVLF